MQITIRNFSINDFEGVNVLMNQVHKLHMDSRPDFYRNTNEPISEKDFFSIVNNDNIISILAEIKILL